MAPLAVPSSSPGPPSVRTKVREFDVLAVGAIVMHVPLDLHLTHTTFDMLAPAGSRLVGRVTVTVALPPVGTRLIVKV